jgi:expansin
MRDLLCAALTALAALLASACGGDRGGGDGQGGGGAGMFSTAGSGTPGSGGPGPGVGGSLSCGESPLRSGEATYYDFADGSGNCSFPATPEDLRVAAMNAVDYASSAACGACVAITGPKGQVSVRIVDQCPGCPQGDIDLSPEAFEQIADLSAGRVDIEWRYVPCAVQGPLVYHFKEGSNEWWTAVQVRNHRYAIAELDYRSGEGAWVPVARESYNYFVEAAGMGPGPYALRVTDVHGQVVEDDGIPLVEAGDAPGAAQLGDCQ